MTGLHPQQKRTIKTSVIDNTGSVNRRKGANTINPHCSLFGWRVRPKRVLSCGCSTGYAKPDKIVKLLVRIAFDVQVNYGRVFRINPRAGGQVDLLISNS